MCLLFIYGILLMILSIDFFFFFKQTTAYEMRISAWSSDVCASDLPNTGIVHQVNLENLARVVMECDLDGETWALPDTVFGTDSHTTMINGIGVLGWGVGGIEAEAAMLGQPSSMLIPQVVRSGRSRVGKEGARKGRYGGTR